MNDTEREAIILNTAWEMIDGMVNWSIFTKTAETELSVLWFPESPNRNLFLILLSDFLSQVRGFGRSPPPLGLKEPPSNASPSDRTFLFHLRSVCAHPILGNDTTPLSDAVEALASWLEREFVTTGVNLHNLDGPVDMRLSRIDYIRICGDIAKHSVTRLEGNVKRLQTLLQRAGVTIDESQAYLAFPSFFEWFYGIFVYHATAIAELLNNIRWALFDYVGPEFQRAYHRKPNWTELFPIYGFHVPADIEHPVAHAMYWDLMNRARARPYVQRFIVPDHAKTEY